MLKSGSSIICRAVELDESNRFLEALVYYREGIQLLLNVCKEETDALKKEYFRNKVQTYMGRAEVIKAKLDELKQNGSYHELIQITNDATGYSYYRVFNKFLDEDVKHVVIEDPYIRSFHQCQNLVKFNEVLVKNCANLKEIKLITTTAKECVEQENNLSQIKQDLSKYNISFVWEFSKTLHDRQISLSTGWIFKIGRGLDYFKAPESKFSIGFYDLDFRKCYETTVDIFHASNVKKS